MKRQFSTSIFIFLFIFGVSGIVHSQWTKVVSLPGSHVYALVSNGSNIFAATDSGAFRSSDNGAHWVVSLPHIPAYQLFINGQWIYAGTSEGFYISIDNGYSWILREELNPRILIAFAEEGGSIFAGSANTPPGMILSSSDNGISWIESDKGISATAANIRSLLHYDSKLFAGTSDGIYVSPDSGANWEPAGFVQNRLGGWCVNFLSVHDSKIYANISPYSGGADTGTGCFMSEDGGANWISSGLSAGYHLWTGGQIFEVRYDGVYISNDNGLTWYNTGLKQTHGVDLIWIIGEYIYAAIAYDYPYDQNFTHTAIYRRPLSDFGISEVRNPTQSDLNISLSPNPTTGIITIHNASANIANVTIQNVLGERVLEIAKPNTAEFSLDLSKLPAGTYFARFMAAGEVITKKIIRE